MLWIRNVLLVEVWVAVVLSRGAVCAVVLRLEEGEDDGARAFLALDARRVEVSVEDDVGPILTVENGADVDVAVLRVAVAV